jgi:hypothetical protein
MIKTNNCNGLVSGVKTTIYYLLKVVFVSQQERKDTQIYNQNEASPVGVKKAGMPAPPAL